MCVKVLFFGMLKDIVGRPEEDLDVPAGGDLGSIYEHYAARFPRLREMAGSIVMARNREFADLSASVSTGDEIAFLPPVSGGSGRVNYELAGPTHYCSLTRSLIDTRTVISRVMTGAEGAVVTFEG